MDEQTYEIPVPASTLPAFISLSSARARWRHPAASLPEEQPARAGADLRTPCSILNAPSRSPPSSAWMVTTDNLAPPNRRRHPPRRQAHASPRAGRADSPRPYPREAAALDRRLRQDTLDRGRRRLRPRRRPRHAQHARHDRRRRHRPLRRFASSPSRRWPSPSASSRPLGAPSWSTKSTWTP